MAKNGAETSIIFLKSKCHKEVKLCHATVVLSKKVLYDIEVHFFFKKLKFIDLIENFFFNSKCYREIIFFNATVACLAKCCVTLKCNIFFVK